jgi:hypothetical protein
MALRVQPYLIALGIDPFPALHDTLATVMQGHEHLGLVGDANAFVYEMPMSRLHYRTVFDLDVRGRDPITAWQDGYPPGVRSINYDELRRFARTYYGIPAPPENETGRVIRAEQ